MKFTYYTDPGHGWVKVPRKFINDLGIARKISPYSYSRGDQVYLEEDCDYGHLARALNERGIQTEIVNRHTNRQSKIRSYNLYISE